MKSLRAKLASLRSTEKADKKYEKSDPAPESVPVTDGMEKASADLVMDQPGAMTSDAPAETPPRLVVAHFMVSPLIPSALSQCSAGERLCTTAHDGPGHLLSLIKVACLHSLLSLPAHHTPYPPSPLRSNDNKEH